MSSVALDSDWLRDLRRSGERAFAELGVPTGKQESWRYSKTERLAALPLHAGPRPREFHIADLAVPAIGSRIFLVDGHVFTEPHFEPPVGATVLSLAVALADQHPMTLALLGRLAPPSERALTALNTSALDDGVLIDVSAGVTLDRPIHIVHTPTASATTHPRMLVRLGAGARATMVESFVGAAADALSNAVTEVELADGSSLEHVRTYQATGAHVGATHVAVERNGHYSLHDATVATELARQEVNITLRGTGARASLGGLLLGRGNNLVDHQVNVIHAAPSTTSEQLYKTVLDDHAIGTFSGKVVVQSGAAGANAQQSSRALLLSEHARSNAKPQLEIYTDDVRCTHGATSGQLDEDALFYLRARGIDEDAAQRMLTMAFADEWLLRIDDAELRESIASSIRSWLEERQT